MEDIDDVLNISLEYVEVIIENISDGVHIEIDVRQGLFPLVHQFFISDDALSLTNKKKILDASIKSASFKNADTLSSFDNFFIDNSESILKDFNDNIKEVSNKVLDKGDLPDIRKGIVKAISSIKSRAPFEKVLLKSNTMSGDADKMNAQSCQSVAKYFLSVVHGEHAVEKTKNIIQQATQYKNTVIFTTINQVIISEDAPETAAVAPIAIKTMQRKQ